MKKFTVLVCSAAAMARFSMGAVPAADASKTVKAPLRAVLVVQNHTSDAPVLPLAAFADTLTASLSGERFRVINPYNAIGTDQNRTARGEPMPEVSAAELARILEADAVITASIQELRGVDIGVPAIAHTLKAGIALNLADAKTGESPFGAVVVNLSRNYTVEQVRADAAALFEDIMHGAAKKATDEFLAKANAMDWHPETASMDFTCNIPGAVIKVDGAALGTLPMTVEAVKGVHVVRVEYPFCIPYESKTRFSDGGKFDLSLRLTSEGLVRYKNINFFVQQLELRKAAGETENLIRLALAEACAQCHIEQVRSGECVGGKKKSGGSIPVEKSKSKNSKQEKKRHVK